VRFVSVILNYAVKKRILNYNPCVMVDYPAECEKDKEFYTVEEVKKLLELLRNEGEQDEQKKPIAMFFTLAAYMGARKGDAYVKHTTQKNMKIFSPHIKTQRPFKMFGVTRLSFYTNHCKFPLLFFCFYRAAFGRLCQAHDTKKYEKFQSAHKNTASIFI
jgi:hypothetical protein